MGVLGLLATVDTRTAVTMSQQKSDYVDETEIDESLDDLPATETIEATVENLEANGFDVVVADDADDALAEIQSHIPEGASVMNGHSTTLEEIDFVPYLSEGDHDWESLPDDIWSIADDAERQAARRESQTADYFLGGVNAIAQTGELVAADRSGSRIGAYPFAASNVVIVSGVNKIVPTLEDALDRLESVAYPLENERAQEAYGVESAIAKQLIFRQELEEGRTTVVLIREQFGY
jgi:L-lactate utilization protein LutB